MIRIIPAIDIIDGKCVRLTRGEFDSKKVYDSDPLAVAQRYEAHGIRHLHLVDLDGAKARQVVNWRVLETIAAKTGLTIDFGGGIQSEADLLSAFDAGAAQVTAGSIAVRQPETVKSWLKQFGGERIILGADVRDRKIAIHAWEEQTALALEDFIQQYRQLGIRSVICTDVGRDGALMGPATELYRELKLTFPDLQIIASGGVSKIEDVAKLNEQEIDGVIIGKALYEEKILLSELEPYLC